MDVESARATSRDWVTTNLPDWPGLTAAHLVGGITTMPDDAPFPATRDVDVHLIFADGSPALRAEGPFLNIVAAEYGGLLFEAGVKPVADYASPELVLANPEIAHHLTVDSALYDPDGLLAGLRGPVTREYSRRAWVQERVAYERRGFAGAVGMLGMARGMYGASGEANLFGYMTTYLVAALSIANLEPPRLGGQMLVRIRPLLERLDRLDIVEGMLTLLGVQEMRQDQAELYLVQAAEAFDLAVMIRATPHPFQHKLHAHLRPYLVDSSAEMIRNRFHREALAWITPCFCSATDVILADGREEDKPRFAANRDAFLNAIGFDGPDAGERKLAQAWSLHDRVFALTNEINATHPEIRD
jgi:hypothetical protein